MLKEIGQSISKLKIWVNKGDLNSCSSLLSKSEFNPIPKSFLHSVDQLRWYISHFASNYLQTKAPHQIRPNSCAAVEAPIRACHMAYRRKQVPTTGPSTFESPFSLASPPPPVVGTAPEEGEAPSLAAQAIRASAAHRDSSLSSAYGDSVVFHHDSGRATVSSSRRSRVSCFYMF